MSMLKAHTMASPVSIITGFLGSGKTTLLRHLLERGMDGRRVALVVNEIGELGFDGRLLEGRNIERMIELTGGCICCSVGSDFLLAMEELIDTVDPDLVLIETTGVAEPAGLARQVRAADLPLDSVVTVVDAANLAGALELATVTRWQIRSADFVVLNKLDLVSPDQLQAARATVREHNTRAVIFETTEGVLDWELLFHSDRTTHQSDDASALDHLHVDGIATCLWRSDLPLNRERFEGVLRELPSAVYRLKGHVYCSDAPWPNLVNYVCGRANLEATRFRDAPAHLNELVLIGQIGLLVDKLRASLDFCTETGERAAAWLKRYEELN